MITVSQEQLDTVEYLMEQSAQGNHVLFSPALVRQVFENPPLSMSTIQAEEVGQHIEKMITMESLESQKDYLDQLPKIMLYHVIKTYFNIVENNLFKNGSIRH